MFLLEEQDEGAPDPGHLMHASPPTLEHTHSALSVLVCVPVASLCVTLQRARRR